MRPNPQFPAVSITFTEEILNGKIHFLCSVLVFAGVVIEIQYGSQTPVNTQEFERRTFQSHQSHYLKHQAIKPNMLA